MLLQHRGLRPPQAKAARETQLSEHSKEVNSPLVIRTLRENDQVRDEIVDQFP